MTTGEFHPKVEPQRFLSLMVAITVVHFAAIPWLSLRIPADPWDREELEKHKHEILLVARTMLGIGAGGTVRGTAWWRAREHRDGGLTMQLVSRKRIEIQEIQPESLDAQPRSSFKPVQAWALAGGAILAVQLYVWASWVTGPYFVRVPAGPSDPPTWMKTVLVTWTGVIMLGLPVAIYYIVHPALASGTAHHDRRHADGGVRAWCSSRTRC